MTPERFRRLARELPGAIEGAHHDHPDFRANGRVFASLHPDGLQAMIKVPPAVQQRLCARPEGAFTAANGAWGRAGCTMIVLSAAPPDVVSEGLREAWEFAAGAGALAKKPRRKAIRKAKPSARRSPPKP